MITATTDMPVNFDVFTAGGLSPRKEDGVWLGQRIMPILAAAYKRRNLTDRDRSAILDVIEEYEGECFGNGVFNYERYGDKPYGFQRRADFVTGYGVIWDVYCDVPDNTQVFGPRRPALAGDMCRLTGAPYVHVGELLGPTEKLEWVQGSPDKIWLGKPEEIRQGFAANPPKDYQLASVNSRGQIFVMGADGRGLHDEFKRVPTWHMRNRKKNIVQSGRPRCKKGQ